MLSLFAMFITIIFIIMFRAYKQRYTFDVRNGRGTKEYTDIYQGKDWVHGTGILSFICGFIFLATYNLFDYFEVSQPTPYLLLFLGISLYLVPLVFMYVTNRAFKKKQSDHNKGEVIATFFSKIS
jgi:hypothetical protein